jgi:quercetin dioxygenase-like cupin family protein
MEVDYAPGTASVPHTRAKSAFVYRAGESWSEPLGTIHPISRNASKTEPARLLAVFVLDTQ